MNPRVYNIFKPKGPTSNKVLSEIKRSLRGENKKIGHFGTLDPFACGVLLVGINGASKLNEYIHNFYPKTYIACGVLGLQTKSGDLSDEVTQRDNSNYLTETVAKFDQQFLQEQFKTKFLGEYWQAPPQISAAKFQGRPLHEWARKGVEIKKEKKKKYIYDLQIIRYQFPHVIFKVTVSSGTYVRKLFEDMAEHLGTLGALKSLLRYSIGEVGVRSSIFRPQWKNLSQQPGLKVNEVLPLQEIHLDSTLGRKYSCGQALEWGGVQASVRGENKIQTGPVFWMRDSQLNILGLAKLDEEQGLIKAVFNFS